jgi:sterol 3beta-glucosyltransferase
MDNKEPKKISIVCNGSRGDFQPYLALGIELKEAGHDVRILTNIAYKKDNEEFNIKHVTLWESDMEKKLREDPELLEIMASGDAQKLCEYGAMHDKVHAPAACKVFMEEITENRPDMLVAGSFGDYFGLYAEHILKIPTIEVKLQSMVCTKDRAPFGIPAMPNGDHAEVLMAVLGGHLLASHSSYDDGMEAANQTTLGSVLSNEFHMEACKENISGNPKKIVVVCQSPLFKKILASGSSDKLKFVGPSIMNVTTEKEEKDFFGGEDTKKRFEKFINEDPENKPVYCGWGSMVCKSPEFMVEYVTKALQLSGERGIVLGGFAGLSLELLKENCSDEELITYAEKNILFLNKVSHEKVFPLMKCIVHHGGAGTLSAAFRSGVPNIIIPVFADQFDHVHVVNELGNGIGFSKQFQQTTAEELAEAIRTVVSTSEMSDSAKEVKNHVIQDDGKKVLVAMIEEQLATK